VNGNGLNNGGWGDARMAAAALVPRVRTIIICDDVAASEIEAGVFNLEGVRQHLYAASFPQRADLSVFLLLSDPRKGRYSGRIKLVRDRDERVIRYKEFVAAFEADNELFLLPVEVRNCVFPEPGQYTFQVYFSSHTGEESLKGEHPFPVLAEEE
jgi:hypothetical protein